VPAIISMGDDLSEDLVNATLPLDRDLVSRPQRIVFDSDHSAGAFQANGLASRALRNRHQKFNLGALRHWLRGM
jgi:hypothetical protein